MSRWAESKKEEICDRPISRSTNTYNKALSNRLTKLGNQSYKPHHKPIKTLQTSQKDPSA